jgi:uncharacterized membrane protein
MRTLKSGSKVVYGLFFVLAGVNHFRMTDFYLPMMPPWVPLHLESVYLSGVAEVGLGVLLLFPRTSVASAWGLIVLLIAVFPANLHMAQHPDAFPDFSQTALWARLPLQGVLIAWAFWYTRPPEDRLDMGRVKNRIW